MSCCHVVVLEFDSHPEHNKGPDHATCAGLQTHLIYHSSQPNYNIKYQTTNPLIVRYLFGTVHGNELHGNELRLFGAKAFLHTRTITVAHLKQHQQVQLLTSLAMTQDGLRIEAEHRTERIRYVLGHGRGLYKIYVLL